MLKAELVLVGVVVERVWGIGGMASLGKTRVTSFMGGMLAYLPRSFRWSSIYALPT